MEDVISDVVKIINDWKTLGTLAGVIATVQLLVKSLKFKPINNLFTKYKIKWIKPYIAIVLGAISGGLGAYSTNADIPNGIIAGILAGMASIGLNESINKLNSSKRIQ